MIREFQLCTPAPPPLCKYQKLNEIKVSRRGSAKMRDTHIEKKNFLGANRKRKQGSWEKRRR